MNRANVLMSVFVAIATLGPGVRGSGAVVRVSVDPSVTHQQINAWGMPIFLEDVDRFGPLVQPKVLELFVNHMGCNAFRWEISRRDWEDYANDNDDPEKINWDAFKTQRCDERATQVVLPMIRLLAARGEKPFLYSSSSFFYESESGTIPEWMFQSPAETSEWLLAHLLYVKKAYGIDIDRICISNEPDNHNRWDAERVGYAIKDLGPRLRKSGLKTTIQFPEHASVNGAIDYIRRWEDDPEVMSHVSTLGYHLYFDSSYDVADKRDILRIAREHGMTTAQTEFMGMNFPLFCDDLVNGGVSDWYLYGDWEYLTYDPGHATFGLRQQYWDIRQVIAYVRPGSWRIDASSDSPETTRVLAFRRDGDVVVVCANLSNSESVDFEIRGMPAGSYGVNCGKSELGVREVGASGRLSMHLDPGLIATAYPTHGTDQAPLMTEWGAKPSFLHLPESETTIAATAVDPENKSLSYNWRVVRQPEGGGAMLASPYSASTPVSGLSIAGDYEFAVDVSDGTNTTTQNLVPVHVVAGNQPPVVVELATRKSIFLQTPGVTRTTLATAAFDPEGDPVTLHWSVVDQPEGAVLKFQDPGIRRCEVTGMSVPGDYHFRLEVGDGHNVVTRDISVRVRPPDHAPEIGGISATPARTSASDGRSLLKAITSDADGDIPGCWWRLRKGPAGVHPRFDHPGRHETEVTGLVVPGDYEFEFLAADNTERAYASVTVTVTP